MKLSIALGIPFVGLLFGGCSTVSPLKDFDSPNNPKRVLYHNWNGNGKDYKGEADNFKNGAYKKKYDDYINTWSTATAAKETDKASAALEAAKIERNQKLDIFITGIDIYYERNKNLLISGRAGTATLFDVTQLALTGTAAFASEGTANVLAAIATAVHGTRLTIDKNLFQDQSSLLIVSKMEELRLAKRLEFERRKTDDALSYSMEAAMRDAIDYYYSGTINGAMIALFNETGKKALTTESELKTLADKEFHIKQREKEIALREREIAVAKKEAELLNKPPVP